MPTTINIVDTNECRYNYFDHLVGLHIKKCTVTLCRRCHSFVSSRLLLRRARAPPGEKKEVSSRPSITCWPVLHNGPNDVVQVANLVQPRGLRRHTTLTVVFALHSNACLFSLLVLHSIPTSWPLSSTGQYSVCRPIVCGHSRLLGRTD